MKYLAAAVGVIAVLLKVLRQGRKITHKAAPIAVEIVQMQRVWTSTGQQGVAAGCAQRLLLSKSIKTGLGSNPGGLPGCRRV